MSTARRLLALCLAVAAMQVSAQDAPPQKLDPQAAFEAGQAALGRDVGNHRLQAAGGRTVQLSDYRGKPLLVSFIYTGCFQTCPTDTLKIAGAVSAVQDLLGHDVVRVASIGFNVPFDSPEAMAALLMVWTEMMASYCSFERRTKLRPSSVTTCTSGCW